MDLSDNGPQAASERVSAGQNADAEGDHDAAAGAERRLRRLADLIASSPHNLVSTGERDAVYDRHVVEAVALAPHVAPAPGSRWLDLGTGGGLPGLVLAVLSPDVRWVLLDATAKKIAAVRGFADELGLPNVEPVQARAEEAAREGRWRGQFDGVIARAVAPLPVLAELARGFLADGGVLAAVKGPAWEDEVAAAERALRLLSYGPAQATAVAEAVRPTWLVTIPAVGPPPRAYPRRSGIPRMNPLGRS